MAAQATRTLNPLHFEDLEPKRFEDLVRQLLYDFRPWRQLEATGRSGSDDGFDVRGWETASPQRAPEEGFEQEEDGEEIRPAAEDRLWLIQCKREQRMGPKQLRGYLDSIPERERAQLYGIIFVAACEFSKLARDMFRDWCLSNDISDWRLWGRSELEDMLFRPQHDALLFAYFGISLRIKRSKAAADVRRQIQIKRKIRSAAESNDTSLRQQFLVRDIEDKDYPYLRDSPGWVKRWGLYTAQEMNYAGVVFLVEKHFAYFDAATGEWDCANTFNVELDHGDPWREYYPRDENALRQFWLEIEEQKRILFHRRGLLPYDRISEIDPIGDGITELPHMYVVWRDQKKEHPFDAWKVKLSRGWAGHDSIEFDPRARVEFFPKRFRRDIPWVAPPYPHG